MISRRSSLFGAAAGLGLVAVFSATVTVTAGTAHLGRQVRDDWWLLVPLMVGFATQVALMVELRRRRRAAHAAAASIGVGAGTSAVGMLACCAHHGADLLPLAGATGIATFLGGVQRPIMEAGVAVNAVAVAFAVRSLRHVPGAPVATDNHVPDRSTAGAGCH